eukprot:NODE_84_length_22354_cov_0.646506.p5 type:complete len:426 gc:universal NODE_84_length_22354_cov_0.646506:21133-19856(-)
MLCVLKFTFGFVLFILLLQLHNPFPAILVYIFKNMVGSLKYFPSGIILSKFPHSLNQMKPILNYFETKFEHFKMYQNVDENIIPTLRTPMKEIQYDYSNDLTDFETVLFEVGHYGQTIYSYEEDNGVFTTPTAVDYSYVNGSICAIHKLKIEKSIGERVAKSQIYCTKISGFCLELKEGFTTINNNTYTLNMVYEFCEGYSLFSRKIHIQQIILQILCCIKEVHSKKLYFGGCLHPYKIFATKSGLIKIGGIGIGPIIFDKPTDIMQRNDLIQFGFMILQIINESIPFLEYIPEMLNKIKETWIKDIVGKCVKGNFRSIDEILNIAAPYMYSTINLQANIINNHQDQIAKLEESKRVANVLFKLGVINERSNYKNSERWAENGGNYLLKLFRDFLFHQVDAHGQPVLDVYHLLFHLNKVMLLHLA